MSEFVRRTIPIYICFIVGAWMIGEYFFNTGTNYGDVLRKWAVDIVAWTSMLGYVLISRTHVVNVLQRKAQWVYSIWLLALMWVMTILGFYFGLNGQAYVFLSTNIMGGTYAAINGVQGFFVLPAAYRAFRARNLESAILLIVGILIIFTNVSVGGALWPDALKIRTWLLNVPVAGAERGIMIAAAIGYIGILLRAMVGLETNWLGAEAKE